MLEATNLKENKERQMEGLRGMEEKEELMQLCYSLKKRKVNTMFVSLPVRVVIIFRFS